MSVDVCRDVKKTQLLSAKTREERARNSGGEIVISTIFLERAFLDEYFTSYCHLFARPEAHEWRTSEEGLPSCQRTRFLAVIVEYMHSCSEIVYRFALQTATALSREVACDLKRGLRGCRQSCSFRRRCLSDTIRLMMLLCTAMLTMNDGTLPTLLTYCTLPSMRQAALPLHF